MTTYDKIALDGARNGMRLIRNEKLKETDWMIIPDCPIDTVTLNKCKVYRQFLRDYVNKATDDEIMTFNGKIPSFEEWQVL